MLPIYAGLEQHLPAGASGNSDRGGKSQASLPRRCSATYAILPVVGARRYSAPSVGQCQSCMVCSVILVLILSSISPHRNRVQWVAPVLVGLLDSLQAVLALVQSLQCCKRPNNPFEKPCVTYICLRIFIFDARARARLV